MKHDSQKLEITTDDDSTVNIANRFIDSLLNYKPGVETILDHAKKHPDCAILQIYSAALYAFFQSKQEAFCANVYLDNALSNYDNLTPREQIWIEAVQASIENRFDDAITLYESISTQWPRDLIASKMVEFHCFEIGDCERQLRYMKSIEADNNNNPDFLAMLALAYELNNQTDRCIEIANQAIAYRADNAWAYHALSHAYSNQGHYHNGIRSLRESESIWSTGCQYIQSHMAFHLAMLHITERDFDGALKLFHQYIWNKQPDAVVEQTDAILLLWALELAGYSPTNEWKLLAPYIEPRSQEFNFPFLSVLYMYAMHHAGEVKKSKAILESMQQFAAQQHGNDATRWQDNGLPLARACMAFAEKDFKQASDLLSDSFDITAAGGSDEQRSVFWQSYLSSLIQSHQPEQANQLLSSLLNHHKTSSPLEQWWQQQINDSQQ